MANKQASADHLLTTLESRDRCPDAFLLEWSVYGETWVDTYACEVNALDKAKRMGGTCTPLFREDRATPLLARVVAWLDRADAPDDDCAYLNGQGADGADGWDDIRAIVADIRKGMQ